MDAYAVLGIAQGASIDEAKKAYRRGAMRWHPDRNPGNPHAERQFKLLKEAYEFLETGKSSDGNFGRTQGWQPNAAPKQYEYGKTYEWKPPAPPPPKSSWETQQPQQIKMRVTFTDVFRGHKLPIDQYGMTIAVPIGTQHGEVVRMQVRDRDGLPAGKVDVKFELHDPKGFYYIDRVAGTLALCCNLSASWSQVLAQSTVTVRNANPNIDDLEIKITGPGTVKVDHAGLPTRSGRDPLYVKVDVRYTSLEDERYDILAELQAAIAEELEKKKYSFDA